MGERDERFALLFRGSPRGHGHYPVGASGTPAGAKVEGRPRTVHEPASLEHFARHLAGTYALGAVPLLLDPPGHTWWAVFDVDDYHLDVGALGRLCAARGLPVVVCRTKSGGAHGYVFFVEPVLASLARTVLKRWVLLLGYPESTEVFPKQDALASTEDSGDSYWGNWINLPYQAGDRSTRYAVGRDGSALTVDGFLAAAEDTRVTATELEGFEMPPDDLDGDLDAFPGAPPCVVRMAAGGVLSGGRNQALFAAAIYYKRAAPERYRELVESFNATNLVPPLSPLDVRTIANSAQKKDYNYRCKESPMCGLCDREACETRQFGVLFGRSRGSGELSLDLGVLVKIMTQPPMFRWKVNGEWVDLSTDELLVQRGFLKRVYEVTNARTRPLKPAAWERLLDEASATARIEVPPPDATLEGQLHHHLRQFCQGRARAKSKEEILLHKPWTDPETGRSCFVIADLLAYLQQQRVPGITERWVYGKLADRGLKAHVEVLKGLPTPYWSVPPQDEQTEAFDVPRDDEDIPF